MALAPVPSKADFLRRVAKPEAFKDVADDTIAAALADNTDIAAGYYGDRATLPLLEVDGGFVAAVCKLAGRSLIGSRGYKRPGEGDSEFVSQAEAAEKWLGLVADKKVHPHYVDSSSKEEDGILVSFADRSDAWVRREPRCR